MNSRRLKNGVESREKKTRKEKERQEILKQNAEAVMAQRSRVRKSLGLAGLVLALAGGAAYKCSSTLSSANEELPASASLPAATDSRRGGAAPEGQEILPLRVPDVVTSRAVEANVQAKPFVFDQFRVDPAHGVELKRYSKPGNRKNIVYILDYHAGGNGADSVTHGLVPEGQVAQIHIYAMLEQGRRDYGKFSLVHESWSQDKKETAEQKIRRNAVESGIGDIYETESIQQRQVMAERVLGKTAVQCAAVFNVVYREQITALYPMDLQQELEANRVDFLKFIIENFNDRSETSCREFGYNTDSSVSRAIDLFRDKKETSEEKECACAFIHKEVQVERDWGYLRAQTAAEREMKVALDSDGSLIYIVAGQMHAERALKYAETHGANYILLSPTEMSAGFMNYTNPLGGINKRNRGVEAICGKAVQNPALEREMDKQIKKIMASRERIKSEMLGGGK